MELTKHIRLLKENMQLQKINLRYLKWNLRLSKLKTTWFGCLDCCANQNFEYLDFCTNQDLQCLDFLENQDFERLDFCGIKIGVLKFLYESGLWMPIFSVRIRTLGFYSQKDIHIKKSNNIIMWFFFFFCTRKWGICRFGMKWMERCFCISVEFGRKKIINLVEHKTFLHFFM